MSGKNLPDNLQASRSTSSSSSSSFLPSIHGAKSSPDGHKASNPKTQNRVSGAMGTQELPPLQKRNSLKALPAQSTVHSTTTKTTSSHTKLPPIKYTPDEGYSSPPSSSPPPPVKSSSLPSLSPLPKINIDTPKAVNTLMSGLTQEEKIQVSTVLANCLLNIQFPDMPIEIEDMLSPCTDKVKQKLEDLSFKTLDPTNPQAWSQNIIDGLVSIPQAPKHKGTSDTAVFFIYATQLYGAICDVAPEAEHSFINTLNTLKIIVEETQRPRPETATKQRYSITGDAITGDAITGKENKKIGDFIKGTKPTRTSIVRFSDTPHNNGKES